MFTYFASVHGIHAFSHLTGHPRIVSLDRVPMHPGLVQGICTFCCRTKYPRNQPLYTHLALAQGIYTTHLVVVKDNIFLPDSAPLPTHLNCYCSLFFLCAITRFLMKIERLCEKPKYPGFSVCLKCPNMAMIIYSRNC